jgi:hypothetical protein
MQNCTIFTLSYFSHLLLPFSVVAALFILARNPRLARIFCENSSEEQLWTTLKAMMTVAVVFFLASYLVFSLVSNNYIEKFSTPAYINNDELEVFAEYYFVGFTALFIVPIYYMKKNRIDIKPLFVVNMKNLMVILKYLLLGALGWISLSIIIYIIHLWAGDLISAQDGAKHVPNPLLEAVYANNTFYLRLYVVILGPFFDEITFRGMVFLLLKRTYRTYISIISSALFFLMAPSHTLTLTAVIAAFGSGILYALLVHKTNSLWPSLLLHITWNSRLFL